MSILKVNKVEHTSTTDGGFSISGTGLVTFETANGSISAISIATSDTSKTLDFATSNNFARRSQILRLARWLIQAT